MTGSGILRGSAMIFFWRVSGAGVVFATQVMLARWMGAAELGVYVLAFSWFLLLATVAGAGLPSAAIRFVGYALANNDHGYVQRYVNTSTGVALACGLGVTGLAALFVGVGSGLVSDALVTPLVIAMLGVPFYTVMALYLGVANACAWYSLSFFPNNFLRPMLFLTALIVVASLTAARLTAALAMSLHCLIVVVVAIGVICVVRARLVRYPRGPAPPRELRLWLGTGFPLLIITLFSNYFPELNVILLGAFLPSSDIAVFHASYRIALLLAFGLFAVDAYISPQIATLVAGRSRQKLQRLVEHATRLRVAGALAAAALFAVAGKQLLGLFGDAFVRAYPALMVLTLAQVVHAAAGPSTRLLSIGGHQNRCLYVFAATFALLAMLTAWLAPTFGVTGAAIATFCAVTCWSIWLAVLVARHMQIRSTILSAGFRQHSDEST